MEPVESQTAETEALVTPRITGLSGGERLRQAREARHLSVDQVASELRLTPRQIIALEEENFAQLPEPTYVCGYVRAYAKFLQLTSNEVVDAYPNLDALRADKVPVVESRITSADLAAVHADVPFSLVALAVLLVIVSAWFFSRNSDIAMVPGAPDISARQSTVDSTPVPETMPAETPTPTSTQVPALTVEEAESDGFVTSEATSTASSERMPESPVAVDAAATVAAPNQEASLPTRESSARAKPETVPAAVAVTPVEVAPAVDVPNDSMPATPAVVASQPERAPVIVVGAAAQPELLPASQLTISYAEDSWTDITDARDVHLLYKLGRAGTRTVLTGVAPFRVFFGYAPGVALTLNGDPVDMTPYQSMAKVNIKIGSKRHNTLAFTVSADETTETLADKAPELADQDLEQARKVLRQSVTDDSAQVTAVASPGTGKKSAAKGPVQRKAERDDFGAQMAPPIRDKSTSSNKNEGRTRNGPAPITNLFD